MHLARAVRDAQATWGSPEEDAHGGEQAEQTLKGRQTDDSKDQEHLRPLKDLGGERLEVSVPAIEFVHGRC